MRLVVCVICGNDFHTKHSRKLTCSETCMIKHRYNLSRRCVVSKIQARYCRICNVIIREAATPGRGGRVYCESCRDVVKRQGNARRVKKYESTEKGRVARDRANKNTNIKRFNESCGYSESYMRHIEVLYVSDVTGVDHVRVGQIRGDVERKVGCRVDKDDLIEFVIHRELLLAIKKAGNNPGLYTYYMHTYAGTGVIPSIARIPRLFQMVTGPIIPIPGT